MECGECTVCCTVCVVEELDKKAGDNCINCENNSCKIYGEHPQTCKEFECAYYQGGKNIELRPDKCGIMFYKKSEKIFTGIMVPNKKPTSLAKEQISSFNKQGYSVVMLKIGEKPHIFLADGHNNKEIYKEYIGGLTIGDL